LIIYYYYYYYYYVRLHNAFSKFQLSYLSSRDGENSLDVVRLEVALEIEDLELIGLSKGEELAERNIGLDDLLLHETLLLSIGADGGSDLGAAHESALGLAEEHTEIIRDLRGLGEDGLLLGLVSAIGGLAVATTLGSLLELTGDATLKLLHVREHGSKSRAESIHLLNERVKLGHHIDLLGRSSDGCSGDGGLNDRGRGGNDNRGDNGSSNRGGSLGLLGGGSGSFLSSSFGAHFISVREVVYTATKRSFFRLQISSSPGEKSQEIAHRG
jgi:hypothetical protein